MTSTIKVDNIQKVSDGSNIIKKCGSTITIGSCGQTVAVATGATTSGMGRTGTVDWQTTKKTTDFTAANGEGYFVDTGSGAVTVTLPASPAAGNIIAVKDYDGNFATANCIVARNGSNIRGNAANFTLAQNNAGATFIYVDATEGWQVFADGSDSDVTETFITASGGTESNCGDFKVHKFTGPGTFTVSQEAGSSVNNEVSYIVVAGGGAAQDAGAGAGGYRERKSGVDTYTASPLNGATPITVTAQGYPITIGAGATHSPGPNAPLSRTGNPSTFSTITSSGGGGGCTACTGTPQPTYTRGGSGGGQRNQPGAGNGNYPPVSPAQGNPAGNSNPSCGNGAAGGGGAAGAGNNYPGPRVGGTGTTSSISGTPTGYAGGGSGANPTGSEAPREPTNTGGASRHPGPKPAPGPQCGAINTGGGGGGVWCGTNGAGGSGIVIIRYKFQ
jgi:hypothetical protein